MNLLTLALIKKAVDENSRSHSPSKKSSSSSSSRSSSSDSRYYPSGSYYHSLTESLEANQHDSYRNGLLKNCIYNLIMNTPELKGVADQYMQNLNEANEARVAELSEKLETYCEPSAAIVEKYNEAIQGLTDLGFDARVVKDSDRDSGSFWYVRPNPEGKHAAYYTAPRYLHLDGVLFDRETFISGKNPFEKALEEYLKNHANYKQEYESLISQIEELEKRKVALFFSSTKKTELAGLRAKYDAVKMVYDKVAYYLEKIEQYKNLTTEQKEKLANYFDAQEDFRVLSEEGVLYTRGQILEITGYGAPNTVKDLIEKSKAEAYDALTPEERKKFEEIPSIIASMILELDDKAFSDLTKSSYYYYGYSYYPQREIYEKLVAECFAKAKEEYQLKKETEKPASQPID